MTRRARVLLGCLSVVAAAWVVARSAHAQAPQQVPEPATTPSASESRCEDPSAALATATALSVELHGGFFGLFNLNKAYTDADPTFGLTVAVEAGLHRYFALGAEADVTWIRSVRGAAYRLAVAPHLRARFRVGLGAGFSFYLIGAAGLAIWPEADTEPALDAALRGTRLGLSFRVSGGVDYALDRTFSLFFGLGYAATSTYDATLAAWVDNVLVSVGLSVRI